MDKPVTGGSGVIEIEVVYAKPDEQAVVSLQLTEGSTVKAAIEMSGLLKRFPELGLADLTAGVFSAVRKLDDPVKQGDRVEIYRPLIHDPKEARRQRALKK